MNKNVWGRFYKWRRVWAVLAVMLMLITLMPESGLSIVKAISDGYSNNLADYLKSAPKIHVYDTDQDKFVEVTDPNVIYDGSTIQIDLDYSLPANLFTSGDWDAATNTPTDAMTFEYPLPGNIIFANESQKDGMTGKITSTNLPNKEAGDYEIVEVDDKYVVKITFNRDVYEYNTGTLYDETTKSFKDSGGSIPAQNIDGDFYFKCEADLNDESVEQDYKFQGKGGTTVIHVLPGDSSYSTTTEKTITANSDGTYTNTITVGTNNRTRGKVTVTDFLGDYFALAEGTDITVTGNGQNLTYSVSSISMTDANGDGVSDTFTLSDLPQLTSDSASYTITYTTTLSEKAKTTNGWIEPKNTVTAISQDPEYGTSSEGDKSTSTASVGGFNHSLISKGATGPNEAGEITYTVTINEAHEDLKGVTIKDILQLPSSETTEITDVATLLTHISDISISAADKDGNGKTPAFTASDLTTANFFGLDAGATAGYKFSSDTTDTNSYVITYKYKMVEPVADSDRNFNNTAYYNDITASRGIGVKGVVYQDKTSDGINVTSEGVEMRWTIQVSNPTNTDIAAGSYTIDEFTGNEGNYWPAHEVVHYLTSAIATLDDGVTAEYYKKDGTPIAAGDISSSTPAYKVKFTYPMLEKNNGNSFTIKYTTFAPFTTEKLANVEKGDISKYYYFHNTAKYYDNGDNNKGSKQADANYQYKSAIHKTSKADSNPVVYSKGMQLEYEINVESNKDATEDFIITDTLPENTTLDESSVWLRLGWWKNYESEDIGGTFEYTYDKSTGKVEFTVPKDVIKGYDRIDIYYKLNIPEAASENAVKGVESFTNVAEGGADTESVTQKVSYPDDFAEKALNKTAPSVDSKNNSATYSVTVNLDKADLNPDGTTIELTDKLTVPDDCINGISIDTSNIKVYKYDETEDNRTQLPTDKWSFTQDEGVGGGEAYSTMTFTLPDEEALLIVYTYNFVFSSTTKLDKSGNPYVPITNIASLTGGYSSSNDNFEYHVTSSGGSAVTHPTMTLYKADSEDYFTHLDGAEFSLERFDLTANSFVNAAVPSFTLGTGGIKLDSNLEENENETFNDSTKTLAIRPHTLYRLKETKAPTNYTAAEEPIYMIFGNQDASVGKLISYMMPTINASNIPLADIKLVSVNQTYVIPNELKDDKYLKFQKVWKKADGTQYTTDEAKTADLSSKIQLWRVPIEKTHYTVTVNVIKNDNLIDYQKKLYVKQYSDITVNFGSHLDSNASTDMEIYVNGYKTGDLAPIGINQTVSKTFAINDDTIIQISNPKGTWQTPSIRSVDYTKPDPGSIISSEAEKVGEPIVLDKSNEWAGTITDLDETDSDGRLYYYYIVEEDAEGYITTYDAINSATDIGYAPTYTDGNFQYSLLKGTLSVTNQDAANNKGSLSVTKTIDGDTYSKTTTTFPITITLRDNTGKLVTNTFGEYNFSNGEFTKELSKGEVWTVTDIPYGYSYVVTEGEPSADKAGFVKKTIDDEGTGKIAAAAQSVTVTNTYKTPTSVTVKKEWDDGGLTALRPKDVTVQLYQKIGSAVATAYKEPVKLNTSNSWTYTWNDLPIEDENGNKIEYTKVEEGDVSGYTLSSIERNGNTFTITNKMDTTSVKIVKLWDDNNDAAHVRPSSIKMTISAKAGTEEVDLSDYGLSAADQTKELNAGNSWRGEWKNLPINYNNKEIEYTVTEVTSGLPAGYTAGKPSESVSGSGKTVTITNKYEMEKTSLNIVKVWDDAGNETNRPTEIQVQLYRTVEGEDEEPVIGETKTLSASSTPVWTAQWTDLDTKEGSKSVTYTAREVGTYTGYKAPAYSKDVTTNTLTITNSLAVGTSIKVNKKWDDNENQDNIRPAEIQVKLTAKAGGNLTDAQMTAAGIAAADIIVTLKASENWTHTWSNLPAYINGNKASYSVNEVSVPTGYTEGDKTTSGDGSTVTLVNKHTPEKVSKKVKKIWDNPSKTAPVGQVTVMLTKNGTEVSGSERILTGDKDADKAWTATWDNLDKYENGEEINYSVKETTDIPGYGGTVKVDESDPTGNTLLLYNSLPEVDTRISIRKTWNDSNNQDGIRPKKVTFNLLADGKVIDTKTFDVTENTQTYEWGKLLLYMTNDPYKEIVYTIEETGIDGYTAAQEAPVISGPDASGIYDTSFDVTNTHEVEKTRVKVIKKWEETETTYRTPVDINLYKTVEGSAESLLESKQITLDTTKTEQEVEWTDLPVWDHGKRITYRVKEAAVPANYSMYQTEDVDGEVQIITITNSYPEKRQISVTKVWDDADDQDGKRPDTIKVHLYKNNELLDDGELKASDNWKAVTWGNLEVKDELGNSISYKVTEDSVAGYTSVVDNTNFSAADDPSKGDVVITNSHTPEITGLNVEKLWLDSLDPTRRPASVKVQLVADDEPVSGQILTLTPDADGYWRGTWANLPMYKDGKEIKYRAKELNVPAGYVSTGAYSEASRTYTITNIRTVPVDVTFSKRGIAGSKELPGAELKIVDENGDTVAEWTSTDTPYTVTEKLEVNKKYTLIEDTAPIGYAVIAKTEFTIDVNGRVVVDEDNADEHVTTGGDRTVIINDQLTSVKVSKVDITGDTELANAHIQILEKLEDGTEKIVELDGKKVEWDSTEVPYEIVGLTTEKTYILRETVAPEGYTLTTDTEFQLNKDGTINTDTSVTTADFAEGQNLLLIRDGLTKLNFTKVGKINEECSDDAGATAPLEGVVFGAYKIAEDGTVGTAAIKTAESNKNGVVVFDGIPIGKYEIREISTIEPYTLDTNVYYAEVTQEPDTNFEGLRDADGNLLTGNKLVNDQPRADIVLTKVSEYNPEETLAGSTYGLYKVNDTEETERLVATAVTDEQGLLTFKGVVTGVTYRIREMAPPDGYYVSKNPVTISFKVDNGKAVLSAVDGGDGTASIDENGNITWLEPSVVISFAKTDTSGNYVAGAVLTVKDSDGNVVKGKDGKTDLQWTSGTTDYEVEGVFEVGKTYSLVEVSAPDGYKIAEPVTFTVSDETMAPGVVKANPIVYTMIDEKEDEQTTTEQTNTSQSTTEISSIGQTNTEQTVTEQNQTTQATTEDEEEDEEEEETGSNKSSSKSKTKTGDNAPVRTAAGLFIAMWLLFVYLRIKKERL